MDKIYFDHNATTPTHPQVAQTVVDAMKEPLNPSSIHANGRIAKAMINDVRCKVQNSLNAPDTRVTFASSGTEVNNIVMNSFSDHIVLVSAIEHASVIKASNVTAFIPVNEDGVIDLLALDDLLSKARGKILISVMLVNNETGVVQPVKHIARIGHKYGAVIHTDAAQAVGKINVDMEDLGVDMVTISSHKFGGPLGVAALVHKNNIDIKPVFLGGEQEKGLRAGTENVPGICGLGKAVDLLQDRLDKSDYIRSLRDKLESEVTKIAPDAVIFGKRSQRVANTSYISMSGVNNEVQMIHFDSNNILLSTGTACSSGKVEKSEVLKAMGYSENIINCAIRVSLGLDNTEEEIDIFIRCWKDIYENVALRRVA